MIKNVQIIGQSSRVTTYVPKNLYRSIKHIPFIKYISLKDTKYIVARARKKKGLIMLKMAVCTSTLNYHGRWWHWRSHNFWDLLHIRILGHAVLWRLSQSKGSSHTFVLCTKTNLIEFYWILFVHIWLDCSSSPNPLKMIQVNFYANERHTFHEKKHWTVCSSYLRKMSKDFLPGLDN